MKNVVTLYISDVHLGTDNADAHHLFKFLKTFEKDGTYSLKELVLVGDIVDITAMRRKNCWNDRHTAVIQKFLKMARKDVKVTYVSGNHDFQLEFINGTNYGNIYFCEQYIKLTNDGRQVLIKHGHQYDSLIFRSQVIYHIGDTLYGMLVRLNKWNNCIRWICGMKQWSLSMWLKSQVKSAISFVSRVEQKLVEEAAATNCSVIIYGHTHMSGDRKIGEIQVLNCGCFTEYNTAVLEYDDGSFEVKTITTEAI